MIAFGDHVEIDLSTEPPNSTFMVTRLGGGQVYVVGHDEAVTISPPKPFTLGRALIKNRMWWTSFGLGAHGIAMGQVALKAAEGHPALLAAVLVGFLAHLATVFGLANAITARAELQWAMNGLRVKFKMRTGEDA